MNTIETVWNNAWRSVLVAMGYVFGLMIAGIVAGILGWQMSAGSGSATRLVYILASTLLLGVLLGPLAARLRLSLFQHFILWFSLIIFNLGSVALEGAYFAPSLVKIPLPILLWQQCLAAAGAALAITFLFAQRGAAISWMETLHRRSWISWVWRFMVSALGYLAFYFVFGGLNYSLVTKPYYESHAGGLTVPAPEIVLILESIRGVLIVFSVLLFQLSVRGKRWKLMQMTGWLLFGVGGIIPLIWQLNSLPLFLLLASAIEIFFQNFLTGAVAAGLMGIEEGA